MTNDKGILIKNIYYMLTYAFQTLRRSDFDTVAAEKFENIHDLFAAILGKGVAYQLKQGLYKEYILQTEERTALRGKLKLQETMKNRIRQRQKLFCEYDELSENNFRRVDQKNRPPEQSTPGRRAARNPSAPAPSPPGWRLCGSPAVVRPLQQSAERHPVHSCRPCRAGLQAPAAVRRPAGCCAA